MTYKIKNSGEVPTKFTDWQMGHPIRYVLEPGEELIVSNEPPKNYVVNGLTIKEVVKGVIKEVENKTKVVSKKIVIKKDIPLKEDHKGESKENKEDIVNK